MFEYDGQLIDKRLYSSVKQHNGIYQGRTPEEIRFKEGDIVEMYNGDTVRLGVVLELPISREKASIINSNPRGLHLDESDDSYVILESSFYSRKYSSHNHVSSLSIFKPRFKIHPGVERRLRKVYNDFLAYPALWEIANTTAEKQLGEILQALGIGGSFTIPRYIEDNFTVSPPLRTGEITIHIDCNKVYNNIDRVRTTLFRIAGKPVSGRAFSIRKYEFPQDGSLVF